MRRAGSRVAKAAVAAHGTRTGYNKGCRCHPCTDAAVAYAKLQRSRGPRPRLSREATFWSRVERRGPDECWLWHGTLFTSGYGDFRYRGIRVRAPRFAFEQAFGPIPQGLIVCHRCDTPRCCNPAHLFAGTPSDNAADRDAKGRTARGARHGSRTKPDRVPRGSQSGNAKLTEEDIVEIRRLRAAGWTYPALADRFGVNSPETIRLVVLGRTWQSVQLAEVAS